VAAFVLDVALGVAYSSGAGLATRGALMMWEGFAIRQGLILTTTLKSAGSTGAAEMSLGRILAASGGAQVGGVALAIPDGFSFVPGMNSYNFVKSGGLDACSK
jgi:hypothetical protein